MSIVTVVLMACGRRRPTSGAGSRSRPRAPAPAGPARSGGSRGRRSRAARSARRPPPAPTAPGRPPCADLVAEPFQHVHLIIAGKQARVNQQDRPSPRHGVRPRRPGSPARPGRSRFAQSSEPAGRRRPRATTCQSISSSAAFARRCFSSRWSNETRSSSGTAAAARPRRRSSAWAGRSGRGTRRRASAYRSRSSNWRASATSGVTALRGRLDPCDEPDPVVSSRDEPDVASGDSSGRRYVLRRRRPRSTSRPTSRSRSSSSGRSGSGSASG